ncbi:MAG TPA: hypothetical protein VIK01_03300 [Polyangiaceae bacterium]
MSLRFLAHFGSFLVIALCEAHAQAAPGEATRLDYARSDHAASCPDREALQSAVVKRLGYDPFFPVARQTIAVQILDDESGLRAEMHLVDADGIIRGSRELSESRGHCDELVAALALAISIALDPSAALGDESADTQPAAAAEVAKPARTDSEQSETSGQSAHESAGSPHPAVAGSATKHRAPPTKTQPQRYPNGRPIGLRAGVFSSLGVAPALAAGFRVGASARRDWFDLTAEFSEQLEASRTASDGGSVIGSLAEGTLAPCFAPNALAACALLNLGSLKSQGKDVPQPVNHRSLYAALGARLELSPQLFDKLYLLVNADAFKSLTPITLRLHGADVWHTPFVSIAGSLGLELRFQ